MGWDGSVLKGDEIRFTELIEVDFESWRDLERLELQLSMGRYIQL